MARRGESTKNTGPRTRKLYARVRARSERVTQPPPPVATPSSMTMVDEPFDLTAETYAPETFARETRELDAFAGDTWELETSEPLHEEMLRLAETGSDAPPPVVDVQVENIESSPEIAPAALHAASTEEDAQDESPAPPLNEMPSERPVTFELEHHESGFFSVASSDEVGSHDEDTRPAANRYVGHEQRRRRAAQYVSGVLAFCGLVAAAGFASRAAAGPHTNISGAAMALSNIDVRTPRAGAASATPAMVASIKADEVPAPVASIDAPASALPAAASATAAPVASAAPSGASPAPSGDGDAKAEKKAAQQALERGKTGLAIEHAERSVELDPTDGEAWLLLGAARQEKGNHVGAREAYGKCLKVGTRGPRHECAAMLR